MDEYLYLMLLLAHPVDSLLLNILACPGVPLLTCSSSKKVAKKWLSLSLSSHSRLFLQLSLALSTTFSAQLSCRFEAVGLGPTIVRELQPSQKKNGWMDGWEWNPLDGLDWK
jgi:hypothetical protein